MLMLVCNCPECLELIYTNNNSRTKKQDVGPFKTKTPTGCVASYIKVNVDNTYLM